jgi:hypothetical protein
MAINLHFDEHRGLFTALKWLCVVTVLLFLLLSVVFGTSMSTVLQESAQGGLSCGNTITAPLWGMLNIAVPVAGVASLALSVLALKKLCSPQLALSLVLAFAVATAAETAFGFWVYTKWLPGLWRNMVWWFRWF